MLPAPPEYLHPWPGALEAWARIVGRLVQRGMWEPIYVPAAAAAAVQCSAYLQLLSRHQNI
jgi:hypothetical protein